MDLLETWLRNPADFVEVGEDRSMLYDINLGTAKGSILGPVLFSLFVAPMFATNNSVAYADDSYAIPLLQTKEHVAIDIGKAHYGSRTQALR